MYYFLINEMKLVKTNYSNKSNKSPSIAKYDAWINLARSKLGIISNFPK